jgi:putative oxidoreductase
MLKLRLIIHALYEKLNLGSDALLLALRLMLAYAFFEPALMKIQNFDYIVTWFGSGQGNLNLPLPYLNALLATTTETVGVILLTLGLFTRLISIPLVITMIVAILTVHTSGFAVAKELSETHYVFSNGQMQFETNYQYMNGFEIPLYYILMLLTLVTKGSGKLSLDHLLLKKA